MTDNEIIKALECHIKRRCWDDCPNATEERQLLNMPCSQMIAKDALDLINHQKAEIDRFEECASREMLYEKVKSEVVKEFAEDFKREYFLNGLIHTTSISDSCIDDFVEEFLAGRSGETNAERNKRA